MNKLGATQPRRNRTLAPKSRSRAGNHTSRNLTLGIFNLIRFLGRERASINATKPNLQGRCAKTPALKLTEANLPAIVMRQRVIFTYPAVDTKHNNLRPKNPADSVTEWLR